MITHLRKATSWSVTSCGYLLAAAQLTPDPAEVTCGSCQRTREYAEKVRQAENEDNNWSAVNAELAR